MNINLPCHGISVAGIFVLKELPNEKGKETVLSGYRRTGNLTYSFLCIGLINWVHPIR